MGLFNRLFGPKDPLENPEIKKYFDIICGKRRTFREGIKAEPVEGNIVAERYAKHFLGAAYDTAKMRLALELYNRSRDGSTKNKADEILREYRKTLERNAQRSPGPYELDEYKAYRLCCPEKIEDAAAELVKVLQVIKDTIQYPLFSRGVAKMSASYPAKNIAIADAFCSGNPIVRKLISDYIIDNFTVRAGSKEYASYKNCKDDIALLAIKALHFEKHGTDKENYVTVGDEEYRKFVTCVSYYKKAIEENPFDTEEYIEKFADNIKKANIEDGRYTSFGEDAYYITFMDDYFLDAVCHCVWKEVTKEKWTDDGKDISNSTKYQDMFNIFRTYFEC